MPISSLISSVAMRVLRGVCSLVMWPAPKQVCNFLCEDFMLTVTTIMKTVIGAGILSLPLTISRLGYVLGVIMFVVVITTIQFTCTLLLKAKNLSKHSNYSSISYHIFRNKGIQIVCSLAILINNLGICIVELTIFKGSLKKIFDSYEVTDAWYSSTWFIVIILAFL